MLDCKKLNARGLFLFALVLAGVSLSAGLLGCSSSKPTQQQDMPPSKYSLSGRVVSIDKAKQQVEVDAKDVPGFMSAMQMGYAVKNSSQLDPLSPEDQITADVMVKGNDVWLENIVVVRKPDPAKTPASGGAHPASTPPAKNN